MDENKLNYGGAAAIIKDAIIRSRYQAAALVNKELLGLYYAIGKYVSDNSRNDFWGKGAIRQLSDNLQQELPGLRGFSESSIKRMREFYEQWTESFVNRPLAMGDLSITQDMENISVQSGTETTISINDDSRIDLSLLSKHLHDFSMSDFISNDFYKVGFTHHTEILAKEKSLEGRLFYISKCAAEFWSVETLKSHLCGDLYSRIGTMPNNFVQTLPEHEQARRAIRAFKDDYLLDFINIEDEIDPDERIIELGIIENIKQLILKFGNKFCFIGNQYRVMVDEQEFFIDLLFFNRELRCLVAVELKRGEFKPSHLGQLNFYLSALDEYVKQPDEAPSIGILLCKEARRNIVEFAVRDYTKPIGVATYRTRNEMPEEWQRALPDFDDMKKLLENEDDGKDDERYI
ncbi:MAG: PDDEXK nuclease domain-containing protein [Methanosarcinales archaeon]|jgi:predicted nuclease of restriction endonuclease-like (RecB) superfamily|nr:PDDEXK nuclease domain-containing protein [Methanosarcinales archaeon]